MLHRVLFIAALSTFLACSSSDDGGPGGGSGVDGGSNSADARPGGGSADAGGNNGGNADAGGNNGGNPDAGGGNQGNQPDPGAVNCGNASCDVTGGNVCCVSISGSQCVPADQCGGGFSATQYCDGPEDCSSGERCCAVFSFGGDVGSFCRSTCDTNSAGDEAELCHNDAQCPDSGDTCKSCQFMGAPTAQNACAGNDIPACNN